MNNISTSIIQTESLFEVVLNTVTDGVTVVDNDLKIIVIRLIVVARNHVKVA
jgi:hypothetical protein